MIFIKTVFSELKFFKKMETLVALFPRADTSFLQSVLDGHNGDVETAAEALLDQPAETLISPSENSDFEGPTLPQNCYLMNIAQQAAVTDGITRASVSDFLPSIKTQAFRSINNGDCAPHAMGLVLTFIIQKLPKVKAEDEFLARAVREAILDFLFMNWSKKSLLSRIAWHEIVYFAHNVAIPAEERETYADWGDSEYSRRDAWMKERDTLYFTTSEFLVFCEMMRQIDLPIVFRLWRQDKRKLIQVAQIPENAVGGLIFDMKHTGRSDTSTAHWQLLRSGSASLTSHKRKRS